MKNWKLSEKAYKLRDEYINIFNEKPRGWSWEEETMEEYEIYLSKKIEEYKKED